MDNELSQILDESIQLELNVADLYFCFCQAFAEDKEFWAHLAEEERNHARLLRSGKLESVDKGTFPIKILTTNLNALLKANKEIKELVKKHQQKPPPSRATAFEIAIKVEESTGEIDFSCFMQQEANSPALKLLRKLNREDRDHARRIRNYMREKGIGIPGTMDEGQEIVG